MPKLVFLGTATNIPDEKHENTHFILVGKNRMVLVDGPGNPYARIKMAGLDVDALTDIVLTHFHPDHVSGIPLLLMALGLSGRSDPLTIYANQHCLDLTQQVLEFYNWDKWHNFPVTFITIPDEEMVEVLKDEQFSIFSSPVKHYIPALGLRFEFHESGKVLAYSGDTAPVESLQGLAHGADILVHEAAGAAEGHSSARQAGELAQQAQVKSLQLVHYPVGGFDYQVLVDEAKEVFQGEVIMAEDFSQLEF
ncbi:MAG: MBL fold metallo-hydrolase [Chloroflexota bacterium]